MQSGRAIWSVARPNLSSKTKRRIHGIDFKNPFTMSNRRATGSRYRQHLERCGKLMSSSSGNLGATVSLTAAPSVARFAALTGLYDVRCKLCLLRLVVCGLVEPIGIEPMT